MRPNTIRELRAADILNLSFLSLLSLVTVVFYRKINSPFLLLSLYSGMIFIQTILIKNRNRKPLRPVYDLIFPTVSIIVIFDSLEKLVHSINPRDIDPFLIKLDYLLFSGYPTVMLERLMNPLLTDILQVSYSTYYFFPVALGIALKISGDKNAFDRSLFLIMLCFYLSYVGYMLMPALGPRFTINHLQGAELQGIFLAGPLQELLNRLEGIKRDAFPSGHTAVTLTVIYLAWRFEKRLLAVFIPVAGLLIFSTVYCRYHYVADIIAGFALTAITIIAGEKFYGYWSKNPHY